MDEPLVSINVIMQRLAWFVGIWIASVCTLLVIAFAIRLLIA